MRDFRSSHFYLRELVSIRARSRVHVGQVVPCTGSWAQGPRGQKSRGSGRSAWRKLDCVSLVMWAKAAQMARQVPGRQ